MGAFIDMTGLVFDQLTVVELDSNRKGTGAYWYCQCSCGRMVSIWGANLRNGNTKRCGGVGCRGTHHLTDTPEYYVWAQILQRCWNPNNCNYRRYGSRGIRVCKRWQKFDNFIADMGERPSSKHSIERKNNNGNYTPRNCKWATKREQVRNTRRNFVISAFGKTQCVSDWWRETGISIATLTYRIRKGIKPERALTKRGR